MEEKAKNQELLAFAYVVSVLLIMLLIWFGMAQTAAEMKSVLKGI